MRLVAVAAVAVVALQAYPPPFPREGVTKLLENARVVVWQVQWTKARPTPMHEHTMDLIGVALEGSHVKVTLPDGSTQLGQPSRFGDVVFRPKGVIHIEESVADTGRTIAIELKNEPAPVRARNTSAPEGFPRDGATRVIDNARIAVWDYQWRPGRAVDMHIHNTDTVVVPIEAGEVRVFFRSGEVRTTRLVPGEVLYFVPGEAHREEASVGTPRAMLVELK